ncbi:MAG: winged helix-turn-helix domain-containing protein [Lentisphaeraceae bacterium]|nr:winged helix-turn-helix domain-containing protein [Lentisphaeraceae bacterium]
MSKDTEEKASNWTFLTNHAHVLLCLAKTASMRIRDLALEVGITERAVQRILAELIDEGYVGRIKDGRRNVYKLNTEKPLKHPVESHKDVKDLVKLIFDK